MPARQGHDAPLDLGALVVLPSRGRAGDGRNHVQSLSEQRAWWKGGLDAPGRLRKVSNAETPREDWMHFGRQPALELEKESAESSAAAKSTGSVAFSSTQKILPGMKVPWRAGEEAKSAPTCGARSFACRACHDGKT
jgi:hypothetical protein